MPKDLLGFDINFLKQIKSLMNETSIEEIEIEDGEKRYIRVSSKKHTAVKDTPIQSYQYIHQNLPVPEKGQSAKLIEESSLETEKADRYNNETKYYKVLSPVIGTFYEAASPGSPAYVKIGDSVSPDSTVCIIEAMKVMNEIKADCAGKIVDILKENSNPVLTGDPIMVIEKI